MAKLKNMRLCGGTFFTILLKAVGTSRKTSTVNGRSSEGRRNPDVFRDLIRTVNPDFKVTSDNKTHNVFTSNYKLCKYSDNTAAHLTDKILVQDFDNDIKTKYSERLKTFSSWLNTIIDSEKMSSWLVAALLDLIEADDTISDSKQFYVLPNGQPVNKGDFRKIENICIPSFVLGVWHYIITQVQDNTVGKTTIAILTPSPTQPQSERKLTHPIGLKTVSEIKTYMTIPDNEDPNHTSTQPAINPSPDDTTGTLSKIPKWEPNNPNLLYQSTMYRDIEQSCPTEYIMSIDLNTSPEKFTRNVSEDVYFKFDVICTFKSQYTPDGSRLVTVSFSINDTSLYGYTSPQNWKSLSTMQNIIMKSPCKCTVWFYVLSGNPENHVIQYLMIGKHHE